MGWMPDTSWLIIFQFLKLEVALDANMPNFCPKKMVKPSMLFFQPPCIATSLGHLSPMSSQGLSQLAGQSVNPLHVPAL